MQIVFEWDALKARVNWRKHRISFDEALTVFNDNLARIFPDPDHSSEEFREIIVGHSLLARLLFVSFVEKLDGRVRIISARKATRREEENYEEDA